MKSGKQKRAEIKNKRRARSEGLTEKSLNKPGFVKANHAELTHNNTYDALPGFYVDVPFICRDCGVRDTWTAQAQKWWYEVAKGSIYSTASRCSSCRKKRNNEKLAQKKHMQEMATRIPHPNRQFFIKTQSSN